MKVASNIEAKDLQKHGISFPNRPKSNTDFQIHTSITPSQTDLYELLKIPGIVDVAYGLEYEDGTMQYLNNQIFIQCFEEESPENVFVKTGLSEQVEAIELFDEYNNIYLVDLNAKLRDILLICRELYESGLCGFAEPNFTIELKAQNTYYSSQWALNNTSSYHINIERAWAITKGNPNIKVAILDDGVELTHPDLQANITLGYDSTDDTPGRRDGSPWANNSHGTAVAGIVGAVDNTVGVIGVAPMCKIVPIRIACDEDDDGAWDNTNIQRIAEGIRYAWQTAQVDVLNNSWGGGTYSSVLVNAINNAVTYGRNGKGCVVVFGSGNDFSSSVSYPAHLNNVIAVGSCQSRGLRSTYSNYGTELDVVAPGGNIYTTDRVGSAGYNSGGDYYANFSGTSAATPHVAGVAALMLSANPDLATDQVAMMIESTAQKIGPYTYTNNQGHPNGTWNNEMGYGLLDAYAAVNKANLTQHHNYGGYRFKGNIDNIPFTDRYYTTIHLNGTSYHTVNIEAYHPSNYTNHTYQWYVRNDGNARHQINYTNGPQISITPSLTTSTGNGTLFLYFIVYDSFGNLVGEPIHELRVLP